MASTAEQLLRVVPGDYADLIDHATCEDLHREVQVVVGMHGRRVVVEQVFGDDDVAQHVLFGEHPRQPAQVDRTDQVAACSCEPNPGGAKKRMRVLIDYSGGMGREGGLGWGDDRA